MELTGSAAVLALVLWGQMPGSDVSGNSFFVGAEPEPVMLCDGNVIFPKDWTPEHADEWREVRERQGRP